MTDTIKSQFDAGTCAANLTKSERSTVCYAESVCVDGRGRLDALRMNSTDTDTLIRFEDVLWQYMPSQNLVALTDDGWAVAGILRRQRAERNNILLGATVPAALAESV